MLCAVLSHKKLYSGSAPIADRESPRAGEPLATRFESIQVVAIARALAVTRRPVSENRSVLHDELNRA